MISDKSKPAEPASYCIMCPPIFRLPSHDPGTNAALGTQACGKNIRTATYLGTKEISYAPSSKGISTSFGWDGEEIRYEVALYHLIVSVVAHRYNTMDESCCEIEPDWCYFKSWFNGCSYMYYGIYGIFM